jgi:hypothetical protein
MPLREVHRNAARTKGGVIMADTTYPQVARDSAHELLRLWRMGWDVPGTSGYQSYVMAHRAMTDMFSGHSGSMIKLAQEILASPRPE